MGAFLVDCAEYRVGRFTLRPHRQLAADGVPVPIGRKALDLLSVLAEAKGALVTKDELMAAVWPNTIVEDNAIQVHIAALRKVLGPDANLLSTAHGLGYRLAVTGGSAPAPPRVAGQSEAPPAEAAPLQEPAHRRLPLRALAIVLVVLAVVAGGAYALFRNANQDARADTPPTIAVLTFQPADNSDGARLFANGLARSVASSLSRYDVTVIAASSSLQLTPAQRPQARSLLGADFIVDGQVQNDHGKVTVSTQVSDTHKNILIFSFDVQGDSSLSTALADQIATHLALSLDPSKFIDDSTRKFTASDYVLIARENASIERGQGDFQGTRAASRALAERYPDDGELQASAGFAIVVSIGSLPESQRSQFMQTARADIARAVRLAPRSGLTYFARSSLLNGPMALSGQERLLRQSMQASPNFAPAYNGLGGLMLEVGRLDEGVALLQRSTQLDPLSDLVNGDAVLLDIGAGREAEAAQAMQREEVLWPNSGWVPRLKFLMAAYFGTIQDELAVEKKFGFHLGVAGPGLPDGVLMQRALATRDKALIRKSIGNCFDTAGKTGDAQWGQFCLLTMVVVGEMDDAFRYAQVGYPDTRRLYPIDDDRWLTAPPYSLDTTQLFSPKMGPFRNDPRFWSVALRTGLINYWQTTGQWPDFCRGQLDTCKARAAQAVRSVSVPPGAPSARPEPA